MAQKGSRSSISNAPNPRGDSSQQKTLIAADAERADDVFLVLKNLAAAMSAVVARLGRLEGTHFDARGPADFGAAGSTTIEFPESVFKSVNALDSSFTGPARDGVASCELVPPLAHPSPQTAVDYIDNPPLRNSCSAVCAKHS